MCGNVLKETYERLADDLRSNRDASVEKAEKSHFHLVIFVFPSFISYILSPTQVSLSYDNTTYCGTIWPREHTLLQIFSRGQTLCKSKFANTELKIVQLSH